MRKHIPVTAFLLACFAFNRGVAQNHPVLPSGKCLLTMKAETVRGQLVTNAPVHIIPVTVTTSGFTGGENLTINTDNSNTSLTGQADLGPQGTYFKDLHFSLAGSTPIEFTSTSIGKTATGEFRFTAAEDNGVYTDAHGTKGSFTLEPLALKPQQPTAGTQEKTIFNSGEEWWFAFKKWMLGL